MGGRGIGKMGTMGTGGRDQDLRQLRSVLGRYHDPWVLHSGAVPSHVCRRVRRSSPEEKKHLTNSVYYPDKLFGRDMHIDMPHVTGDTSESPVGPAWLLVGRPGQLVPA